jgi:hypothetical protein
MTYLNRDYSFSHIKWIKLIDLTKFTHFNVSHDECNLHHTATMSDWVDHFLQEYGNDIMEASTILIERQPPGPCVAIEQLFFSKYRDKTILISPRSIHCYFGISSLDYDKRKEFTVKMSLSYLSQELKDELFTFERSHDVADSICMMLYWRQKMEKEYYRQERKKILQTVLDNGVNIFDHLNSFRYKK